MERATQLFRFPVPAVRNSPPLPLPGFLYPVFAFIVLAVAHAQSPAQLKSLSLEQLTQVEVTSVSRRNEKLVDAAAAVQVLTGDRIIRSGAMTLPDALRLATGLQVSQLDGREWAISARGFASLSAEKMEVSQDGRSLYGPLFSGVLWDVQSVALDDLDRIEIVRGPGAALWGANAVNGVINIVTKPAVQTQGSIVGTTLGARERQGFVRHGGATGAGGFYRIYAHGWETGPLELAGGQGAGDDRRLMKIGGRLDQAVGGNGANVTVQSDAYRGFLNQFGLERSTVQGGNGIARLEAPLASTTGRFRVQANFDHTERDIPATYSEIRSTGEAFAEAEMGGARLSGTFGIRGRVSADRIGNGPTLGFFPTRRTIGLYSLYGQGRVVLPDPRWSVIAGSTLEHNSFTGFEVQPTARLAFNSGRDWMAWAGVSRAVRTPSRIDTDVAFPGPGNLTLLQGSPAFRSEDLTALEIGWRWSKRDLFTLELNAFANRYRHLRSLEPASGTVLFTNRNLLKGATEGAELTATIKPARSVRLVLGARTLGRRLSLLPESRSPNPGNYEGNDARFIATAQASFDLRRDLQLDVVVRHVGEQPRPVVAAYTEADVRLAWQLRHEWEVALAGSNLLHPSHQDGAQGGSPVELVRRNVAVSASWRY